MSESQSAYHEQTQHDNVCTVGALAEIVGSAERDLYATGAAVALEAALSGMAALPARTIAEMAAKARALAGCILVTDGGAPTIEGDHGLAASLIRDVLEAAI